MTVVTSSLPLRERKKRDTRHRILMAGLDAFTARGLPPQVSRERSV